MTTNKENAHNGEQPPADERKLAHTSLTNIILKPLDADSVVALMESWENDPDEEEQYVTLACLSKIRYECWR
jgi:hypothetical protein